MAKVILKKKYKKKKPCDIKLTDFRLYYKAIVIKTVWYWLKNISVEQNREHREMNPCTYGQLICDKGGKNILNGEKAFSLRVVLEKVDNCP